MHIDKLPPGSKRGSDDYSKVIRVMCFPCVEGGQQEYEAIIGVRESEESSDQYYLLSISPYLLGRFKAGGDEITDLVRFVQEFYLACNSPAEKQHSF